MIGDVDRSQLLKNIGTLVRIRPVARRAWFDGQELERLDDDWRLEAPQAAWAAIRLSNMRTGHCAVYPIS